MTASPTGDTIGEILKRTREAKNLSIETVNKETKISVAVIRGLEQDDMESFASETYLKGFLKNYAIYLGLDGNQLWSMLSRQHGKVPDVSGTFWDIEEAVREYVEAQDSSLVKKVSGVDQMFISERDQKPYVVFYGKDVQKANGVVAYEQEGVGGKRFVADSLGVVDEFDEEQFRKRVPGAK